MSYALCDGSVFSALLFTLLVFTALDIVSASDKSFYDLLGVSADADSRTIRRAFKRLALEKHPDKNPEDPDAHDTFVKINRAYEVLKDEELRKRYDQFGEKGLAEDNAEAGNGYQQYQSWEFYNDKFGIYDDDPEIVTLSRADFHEEVFESGEVWFVNFYSTFCSHCHHLAPTWREFARTMDGIVRIGAVNCAEDPDLCQSQFVNAYPSLVLFPKRLWFQGVRELAALSAFLLAHLPSQPLRSPLQLPQQSKPLLAEFCGGEDDDCMSEEDRIKCAAMLAKLGGGIFTVLDCAIGRMNEKLCRELGHKDGFLFFPEGIEKTRVELFFADLTDLRGQLYRTLPALPRLGADELRWVLDRQPDPDNEPLMAIFVPDEESAMEEWRTLALRFPEMNTNLVCCSDSDKLTAICAQLQLGQLPRPVLFRPTGGYDIYYGNLQMDARQLAKFILRSRNARLIVLKAEEYSAIEQRSDSDDDGALWLVDHFVPWCPPCLRLLDQLRKLPSTMADGRALRVGTLDCDVHRDLCRKAGVTSYPHSILFMPDGSRHSIVGSHSTDQLLEFIAEALSPSVVSLNETSFAERVLNRSPGQLFFIDFYAPWCGPCQQLAPEFRRLARQFPTASPHADKVSFGAVDCDAHPDVCDAEYVRSYPTVRLYRHHAHLQPYDYPPNWWRNAQSMAQWLHEMMPTLVLRLAGDFHSTVLGSVEPFLVDFYAPWCGHCVHFAPIFEKLAKLLEGEVRLGKVDCDRFGHICQMAGVAGFPSVLLYLGVDQVGQRQSPQGMFVQHGQDAEQMATKVRELLGRSGKGAKTVERDEL